MFLTNILRADANAILMSLNHLLSVKLPRLIIVWNNFLQQFIIARFLLQRFVDADSDIPGPGTYNPIIPIKCTSSIFPAPFGSYATRFKKDPTHFGPGKIFSYF